MRDGDWVVRTTAMSVGGYGNNGECDGGREYSCRRDGAMSKKFA